LGSLVVGERSLCYYDKTADVVLGAWLSFIRTWLVCIILGGGAYMFSSTAEHLVVDPIEEMLKKVKRIATNPLEA